MEVSNLHSLLSDRWFIQKEYGYALLPVLFSILNKGGVVIAPNAQRKPDAFVSARGSASLIDLRSYEEDGGVAEYVGIVNLKDPIYKFDQECGPRGTKSKMMTMSAFAADPNCAGVVLDIDSGGGQVYGTPEFYDFIKEFPKPVVGFTDGYMCSAAYYVGAPTDHLFAHRRADAIGSIGVMFHYVDMTGVFKNKGANVILEYASKSTEKNRPFDELMEGKPELYIKEVLDPICEKFIADIREVRPDVSEDVFTGKTFDAAAAVEKRLVNELGTLKDAINKVFDLAEGASSHSNSNRSNMSKVKPFPKIQEVTGIEGEGLKIQDASLLSGLLSSGKKGVLLQEEDMDKIEARLAGHDEAIETEKKNVTKAEADVTAITNSVTQAIKDAGLGSEIDANASTEDKLKLLSSKVLEYGKRPSGSATKPIAKGDKVEVSADPVVDPNDAHNKLYDSI